MESTATFYFREFAVRHAQSMKVGTDSVLLGAWARVDEAKQILDVGSGSGVLALMLAQRTGADTHIDAIEIDPAAAAEARYNFTYSRWHHRLHVIEGNFLNWSAAGAYDVIISNPPFFENSLLPPQATRAQARHTVALHAREILTFAARHLVPSGRTNLVLPAAEGEALIEKAKQLPVVLSRRCTVRSRPDKPVERLLLEFSRQPRRCEESELVLHAADNARSPEYRALTRAFYTKG